MSGARRNAVLGVDNSPPSARLRVFKYHALGNSYLILDPRRSDPLPGWFDSSGGICRPTIHLIRTLCDVSTGIGSNGLLFGPLPSSQELTFGLFIMNSDGTRAGFSGNGTRIFAQYLVDAGDARPGQLIALEIQDDNAAPPSCNLVRVRLFENNDGRIEITAPHVPRFGAGAVAAKVGAVQLIAKDDGVPPIRYFIPTISKIGTTMTGSPSAWANSVLVDIGNPHCVTFVAQADQMPDFGFLNSNDAALRAIAFRHIGAEQIFTNGINLQWARLESRKRLRLMIYERGEGPTPASGSSASAAACAAFACGLLENDVEVVMPGGSLDIHIDGSPAEIKAVRMSGFATRILDGEFNLRSLQA